MIPKLTKCYKQVFEKLILFENFQLNKNIYFKLINDQILQTICIQNSWYGKSFTFNVGFFPICIGFSDIDQLKTGTFRLGQLVKGNDFWWDYNNEDEVESLVLDAFNEIKNTILPLSTKIIDNQSYLYYVDEIEKSIYGIPIESRSTKLWVNLKLQNYVKALDIIHKIELQNYSAASDNRTLYINEDEYRTYMQKIEEGLIELRQIKMAILDNNISSINELLMRNEEISKSMIDKLTKK